MPTFLRSPSPAIRPMAFVVLLAILMGIGLIIRSNLSSPQVASPPSPRVRSLVCRFSDITRANIAIEFSFLINGEYEKGMVFEEVSESLLGGQTNSDADHPPTWPFSKNDDGVPMITSPDGATRLVLYGLEPGSRGIRFVEAGLRSENYRNLGGQCRQENLGDNRAD